MNDDNVRFHIQFTTNVAECTNVHIITKLYYSQPSRLLITRQRTPISVQMSNCFFYIKQVATDTQFHSEEMC
jgi:hypothetical protein